MSSLSQRRVHIAPPSARRSQPKQQGHAKCSVGEFDAKCDENPQDDSDPTPNPEPASVDPQQPTPPSTGKQPTNPEPPKPQEPEADLRDLIVNVPFEPGQLLRFVLRPEDRSNAKKHPQARINRFWRNFEPEYLGGVTQILPESLVKRPVKRSNTAKSLAEPVSSYQTARDQCIKRVKRIIRECRALNQKYTDIHFDIEADLKLKPELNCLFGLRGIAENKRLPGDVKRVPEIYEKPQFFKDGATFDDVMQGALGDCWFLSALSALTASEQLLDNLCVIRDEEIGVYGFVFHRDGEWQPCIIDDKLYLKAPSFDESIEQVLTQYGVRHKDHRKKYEEVFQTGSKALYFSACSDENETWVPLLEKAFAKAHGDYAALDGGQTGEALEDLTGGVSTELYTQNILSKDRFWTDTLSHIGKDYLFSCATAVWIDRLGASEEDEAEAEKRRNGVLDSHAYAVLGTYEGFGQRLVKVRNPWGYREWDGAWSDGSKEWTSEWLNRLGHSFGNDGVFWISYEDFLQRYRYLDYTRIFGPEWHMFQQWTQVQVPWDVRDYQQVKFTLDVPIATETMIVLSQLDSRYFRGFEGLYGYRLQFRLEKDGDVTEDKDDDDDDDDDDDYIIRSKINYELQRSVNVTINLEPGKYSLLFKVEAHQYSDGVDVESMVRKNIDRKKKLTQIATLYDLAHSKGQRLENKEPGPGPEPLKDTEDIAAAAATQPAPASSESVAANDEGSEKREPQTVRPDYSDTDRKGTEDQSNQTVNPEAEPTNADATKNDEKPTVEDASKPTEESTAKPADIDAADPPKAPSVQTPVSPISGQRPVSPSMQGDDDREDNDMSEDPQRNPWNAFCTVGLRVYSKSSELKIGVAHPDEKQPPKVDNDDIVKAPLTEAKASIAAAEAATKQTATEDNKEEVKNENEVKPKEEREEQGIEGMADAAAGGEGVLITE